MICCASFGVAMPAWADGDNPHPATNNSSCGGGFLGFRPWYEDLTTGSCELVQVCEKEGCQGVSLSKFVWTAVLNIVFDISLAAGYIAVAMVIYGGYLYMMSQGDPGKMTRGKKTLMTAIVGLVITMGATILVNTLKVVLSINGNGWDQGAFTVEKLRSVFDWAYLAAGIVAVAFVIKSGIDYMTAIGDPGKTQKATRSIIAAVAGLIIVILAAVITSFVVSSIGGAMK